LIPCPPQGLEPGALAALANGASSSAGSAAGLRGRLKALHIEIASEPGGADAQGTILSGLPSPGAARGAGVAAADAAGPWAGAPLSPAAAAGRQPPAPPQQLSAADEAALAGFAGSLEALVLIGLEPQVRNSATKPWEALLASAAEAAAAGGADDRGGARPRLARLALRGCGALAPTALAAAAAAPGLRQADISGSAATLAAAGQLAGAPGLEGLGLAPLCVAAPLLEELARRCPGLARLSVGGLHLPAREGGAAGDGGGGAGLPALPRPAGLARPWRPTVPSVRELQLLGCGVHGVHVLSRGGGLSMDGRLAATFPGLTALEIAGAWEFDSRAIGALANLLSSPAPRLRRLRLEGAPRRPIPAGALLALLVSPAPPGGPGLDALELLCVAGLNDAWMQQAAGAAATSARCTFREVRALTLGGAPPAPSPGRPPGPPPPALAPPPHAASAAASAAASVVGAAGSTVAALAAATAAALGLSGSGKAAAAAALPPSSGSSSGAGAGGEPGGGDEDDPACDGLLLPSPCDALEGLERASLITDRGLVRLFGCSRLRVLELHRFPAVTLAGVRALARGAPRLESVHCAGCPALAAAPPEAVAAAGTLGGVRSVMVRVLPD
jgi:hypothetical protein